MTEGALSYLTPEARARVGIDRMLEHAGWVVQDGRQVNLAASRGVAVREFVLKSPHGRADYLLFVDRTPVGVVEAKKEGETLTRGTTATSSQERWSSTRLLRETGWRRPGAWPASSR